MNKYRLNIEIENTLVGHSYHSKEVFVETNFELKLGSFSKDIFSYELKRVIDKLDVKIGENEIVCNIAVFSAPEDVFQKIVIEEEPKKFRLPEKYDVYQVRFHEYLIRANDHEYLFNVNKNTIKKLKLKYNLPDNIFRMEFDINRIPKNVKFVD